VLKWPRYYGNFENFWHCGHIILKKKSAFIENNLIIAGMVKASQYSLNKILVSLGVLLE
jgi:hypothetical protein